MESSLHDFIRRLPKTETHLHIEGSLPWPLLQAANPGKYLTPPASWAPDFRFRDFAHFESELLGYAGDFSLPRSATTTAPGLSLPTALNGTSPTPRSASPRAVSTS